MRGATADEYVASMALSRWSQRWFDIAVAGVFLGIGWVSSTATTATFPDFVYAPRDGLFVVLLVLATAPYAWCRRRPDIAFVVALVSTTTLWALGYNGSALPMFLLVGAYFVASTCRPRQVFVCGAAALGCFAVLWWAGGAPYGATEAAASVVGVAGAMGLGRASRLRGDLAEARASAAEEAAQRSASEERLRIARELHDVVGHSLGTIAVQAGVGRHLMSTEPASAAEALDNIAQLSRTSLDEVRAVVAALRDGEPAYRPAPGLTDLNGLVETARSTGLSVTLTLPEAPEQIPRQVAAAAFRITREALTNVIRHANASQVSVHVSHDNGHLQIRVHDNGHFADAGSMALTSPGHGIVGMRERAEALQGSLSAERATGGGFLVTASLPMSTQGSR